MQVSVESGEGLQRHLMIDLPAEQVSKAVDEKIAELATQVRLDGFRPGKVPVRVVKQRFGEQVRHDVYGELVQSTFYEAAAKEQLVPVGEPSIEMAEASENEGFAYKATFDVMPEIALVDLAGKPLQRFVAEVSDADVDAMVEKLREQRSTLEDVDRAAKDGDTIHIDFVGSIDGEAFEGGTAEDTPLELGSGAMIDGFESGLLGAKAGEERTIEVTFPEDYRAEHLAGKVASFEIKINRVAEPKLPEIDAEFNKAYGVDEDTVDALYAEVRRNIQLELNQKLKAMCKDNVMELLREANPVDIPQAMIDQESERMKQQMMQDLRAQGQQSTYDLPASLFADQAKVRVHLGLLSSEIIKQQELTASEEDLRATVAELSQSYQQPDDVIDFYMNNQEQRAGLENLVLENKVVDWVLEQVDVQDEQKTFTEIMEPKAPTAE